MGDYVVVDGDHALLNVSTKDDEQKMIDTVSKADDDFAWAEDAATSFMDGHDTTLSQITRFFGRGAEYMTASDYQAMASRRVAKREDVAIEPEDDGGTTELSGSGLISKVDKAQQNVFGWAYVTHDKDGNVNIDKSGDFVDAVEEIEKSAYDFVLHSRKGDADHTNVQGATLVESMVFTPEKIEKMGLPQGVLPLGWWLGFHVDDPKTWERVEKRELTSFSVHGKGLRKAVEDK